MTPDLQAHLERITTTITEAFDAGAITHDMLPLTVVANAANSRTGKITTFTLILTMGWDLRPPSQDDLVPDEIIKKQRGN